MASTKHARYANSTFVATRATRHRNVTEINLRVFSYQSTLSQHFRNNPCGKLHLKHHYKVFKFADYKCDTLYNLIGG